MRVIYITHFDPLPVGHGGFHRSYQVLHDLEAAAGRGNVFLTKARPRWWNKPVPQEHAKPAVRGLRDRARQGARRVSEPSFYFRRARRAVDSLRFHAEQLTVAFGRYAENPFKLFTQTEYTTRSCRDTVFLAQYAKSLEEIKPDLCVIEHTTFADVIPINKQRGIPTICCPQNIEALDMAPMDGRWSRVSAAVDLGNEIRVMKDCRARLLISRVETALVSGLGVDAQYYPYLPIDEIRVLHMQIRADRLKTDPVHGLFAMLGSAEHGTTREAFDWFIQQARLHGLPPGVRVVVAGSATQSLMPNGGDPPNIELQGWLGQAELRDLLVQAQGMLVPQRGGFGAVTRLPEFSCAGIPVIVSRHPTYAMDLPPGANVTDDTWQGWCGQIQKLMREPSIVAEEDYERWEARQPRTLSSVVADLALKSPSHGSGYG